MDYKENLARIQSLVTSMEDQEDFCIGAITPPVFETSIFRRDSFADAEAVATGQRFRYTYSRGENPTVDIARRLLARMEKGESAQLFGSGTGAIYTALLYSLKAGDHAVIERNAYGRATNFLKNEFARMNVTHTLVDGRDFDNITSACRDNTTLIYLESPSSWQLDLQDLPRIAAFARARGILTAIDNTWATPVFQNPIDYGIDMVIHSVTKYLGGHSDLIGGAIVSTKKIIDSLPQTGAVMTAASASRLLRSLRTLPFRMPLHQQYGLEVASLLEASGKVKEVKHPGLPSHPQHELAQKLLYGCSGVFSFVLDTDRPGLKRFFDNLSICNLTASWGGYESVIWAINIDPNFQEGSGEGCKNMQIRLSVGLEPLEQQLEAYDRALRAI